MPLDVAAFAGQKGLHVNTVALRFDIGEYQECFDLTLANSV